MTRIPVNSELLTRARERARLDALMPARQFSKLISGELRIANTERFPEDAT